MRYLTRFIPACFLVVFALTLYGFDDKDAASLDIEPKADELLRQMSDWLTRHPKIEFEVLDSVDIVYEGQKLQFSHRRKGFIEKPYKLRVDTEGDITNRSFWKDEKKISVLNRAENFYMQMNYAGTIDETIDFLMENYDVNLPLADLLSKDPYAIMVKNVQTGQYIGEHMVDDYTCHHLAFTQQSIDWQVWIQTGNRPILRKVVITYKEFPEQPQYSARIKKYKKVNEIPPDVFQFTPPPDAVKRDLVKSEMSREE